MIGGHNVHFDASAIGFGLFVNWKISGVAYNDYANYRVGSPITITSVYHDCNGDVGAIYDPVFCCPPRETGRVGLFYDNDLVRVHRECGSRHYPLIYCSKNSIKIIYINSFN